MKTLLTSIRDHLDAELSYLKSVTVVPDLAVIPDESAFPMVCLLDNGDENSTREKGARLERLRVSIGVYQAVAADEATVLGDGTEKGVLDIKDEVMNALRDKIFTGGYQAPFYIRSSRTQTFVDRDFQGFVAFKTIDLEYLREVVEAV